MTESMIYPKRVNAINGEPGGGKTWVSLKACAEAIAVEHVIFIDLEDHADTVVARLRALGADDEDIRQRFHYVKPDRPMSAEAIEYLERKIVELEVGLVVIDSVGELMSLQGVKPNDDDAVAALYRAIPRRLARLGPAVLLIDHVPKNNAETPLYAIGSQRKRAAIDGASFMVATVKAFAAGTDGMLKLVTAKDRIGNFATGSPAALVNVTSAGDGASVVLEVTEPDLAADGSTVRQTNNMERVSRYLEALDGRRAKRSDIEKNAGVSSRYVTKVIDQLAAEGFLRVEFDGPGRSKWCTLVREFRDGIAPGFTAAPRHWSEGSDDEF